MNVVHAMLLTGSWEAIRGMGVWLKQNLGITPPWIVAAEADAKSRWGSGGCLTGMASILCFIIVHVLQSNGGSLLHFVLCVTSRVDMR